MRFDISIVMHWSTISGAEGRTFSRERAARNRHESIAPVVVCTVNTEIALIIIDL